MKLFFFIRNVELSDQTLDQRHIHSHSHHELVYCYKGEGFFVSERGAEPIKQGDLIFCPTGQKHNLYCEKNRYCRISLIYFSEELFSASINVHKDALFVLGQIKIYTRMRNLISLSNIGSERIGKICDSIMWEFQKRYRGYSWTIRLKLIELLITLLRDKKFTAPIRGDVGSLLTNSHIQDVLLYLHVDYMNPITIEDVLQFCPLSRSHFHALFKKETGKTFIQYLNTIRIQHAGELLVTTNDSVLDISLKTGFNNLSHFCHIFKLIKGVSPREFRSRFLG